MTRSHLITRRGLEAMSLAMEYAETVPNLWRRAYKSALDGALSPRSAIKAKCYECVGYEDAIFRVTNCTTFTCPLWAYRPINKSKLLEVKENA